VIAGIDDMRMCEISLPDTGLSTKQDAEILEQEFEQVLISSYPCVTIIYITNLLYKYGYIYIYFFLICSVS